VRGSEAGWNCCGGFIFVLVREVIVERNLERDIGRRRPRAERALWGSIRETSEIRTKLGRWLEAWRGQSWL
jgi:hypothetical protein